MGRLLGIAVSRAHRARMEERDGAAISIGGGLDDDLRRHAPHRQVTVLTREGWAEAEAELGVSVDWTVRRANLLLAGVDLVEGTGARLRVGDVVLEITGQTRPCQRMEVEPGLQAALGPRWRAGATCRVLAGGVVRVGDEVTIERASATDRPATLLE